VLPIARADGQNDTHRVVLAEPVGLSTESSFESRVRVRLTRLFDRRYRALADRSRLVVGEVRRADEKQSLRWPDGSFASTTRNSSNSIRSAAAEAISGYRRDGRQRLRLRGVACGIPSGTGCGGW
jgi:hypothetical protein